ncbi:MAG: valine--tRNA ligase [Candidatus Lokiarchaeota archaeon]|nr:valine--tRNA ligase [Candidatus Lokiarchaeota archaeon]MBD3198676.1 valine--tRNA ligase [Candidatus Lokiarchaeota archaeon]
MVNNMANTLFPKRFKFNKVQKKWISYWREKGIYDFDIEGKGKIFSIDTPPPFVSGTLHLGHVLNHSWIDFVARYHKMKGKNVYFPQGFDCHGLPVELAVEKNYGISKDDRERFLEKCVEWVEDNISNMTKQFDDLGYSTDWKFTYRTMDENYKYKVQKSLLYFYEKGWLYRDKFPTHFCVNCETSVAKAEVGYQEEEGKLWYIKLPLVGRDDEYVTIATTRPEMMESCVGVFIHPNDDRYYHLSAAEVELPIANRTVRIRTDNNVDMTFGTGVVYCCTYGDETDIKWKLDYDLDEIQIFTKNGLMNENSKYQELSIEQAREKIVNDLEVMGLIEKIETHEHNIIIHSERSSCRRPIEYLPVDQWFINVKDFTTEIIDSAESMDWYPEKHKQRLLDWAEGLDWNWVISRQRVFGTPIPFWYCSECGQILIPESKDLPLDPVIESPPSNKCPNCDSSNIIGEEDVCDCWVDSSITPLAIAKWLEDDVFFTKTYTNARVHRPQGYEIIRTWLFYTLFRCKKLTGKAPFHETMINGMVAGPDGRKMSKSYGNVVSPDDVLPEYGADAIRQWAAMGSLGDDYPFEYNWINIHNKQPVSDEKINKEKKQLSEDKFFKKYRKRYDQLIGASRFLTKIWNAYRFLNINLNKIEITDINVNIEELPPIDSYFYSQFNEVMAKVEELFDNYNWHEAFMILRPFFWNELCDNYIEAIKYKFYSDDETIRKNALKQALTLFYSILRIFGIIMPFISEEIYSILYKDFIGLDSIHQETWPKNFQMISAESNELGRHVISLMKSLRKFKSKLQIPLNQEINKVVILLKNDNQNQMKNIIDDIKQTIRIKDLSIIMTEEPSFKAQPDLKEVVEELDATIFLFK